MSTHTPLGSFEDSLLRELRDVLADRRRAASRRRIRTAATATACLIATTGVVASLESNPAFAVQEQPDGDVVVTIDRLTDSAGLERALADHHVSAHVEYHADLDGPVFDPRAMPAGTPGAVDEVACSGSNVPAVATGPSNVRITIPAATVATGEELSIFTAGSSPSSARLLVAFGDRDSGCGAFDGSHGWFTWVR
jgi:hypothetical protein